MEEHCLRKSNTPTRYFPLGTIELVPCILIRETVKVGRLQWIDWFLSIALKLPASYRFCAVICWSLLPSYENRIKGVTSKIHIWVRFNSLKTELFCKNNLVVCICSLVQWGPREEKLLGRALQEMEKQQDTPSLQGTVSTKTWEKK